MEECWHCDSSVVSKTFLCKECEAELLQFAHDHDYSIWDEEGPGWSCAKSCSFNHDR